MGLKGGASLDSGLVMYPSGHARNTTADLRGILDAKFRLLGRLAVRKPSKLVDRLSAIGEASPKALRKLLDVTIEDRGRFE
jgi:2-methylcitrate dehydratase